MSGTTETIERLAEAIIADNPVHSGFLHASISEMSAASRRSLVEYVDYCVARGRDLAYLADCYNTITKDTLAEQLYFMKHGRYRYARFSDVAGNVYFDDEYMNKYMYGLALTSFLWPNHARLFEFFEQTFPRGKTGAYLEIGPGHGSYLRRAAELGDFDLLLGIDISPTSVAMTRDVLANASPPLRAAVRIVEADFLNMREESRRYACIVMGEVLEHVEEPDRFLHAIAAAATPETHVFVTTCVNAPAVDHIYLFRSTDDVEALVDRCGFDVVERCYAPATGKTLEECRAHALAINVAYVLRKR